MLDNFGMGEFLMLALFALLFFGPERLPQIGAQLGRWLSKLTSYSKAFMTQWSEEAAAVQGAVQDVISIRDEIRAAQAEISETLNAAQQDINDTIAVAKGTIREATPTAEGFVAAGDAPALADAENAERFRGSGSSSTGGDDSEALSKTQDIVNSLLAKQGVAPLEDPVAESEAAEPLASADAPETDASEAGTAETEASASEEDEAYQRNLAAIQEIMKRSSETVPDPDAAVPAAEAPAEVAEQEDEAQSPAGTVGDRPEQPVATQPGWVLPGSTAAGQQDQTESKREETESAFDKTQRVLNQLMGIEPEPEPEPVPEPAPAASPESRPDLVPGDLSADAPADASTDGTEALPPAQEPRVAAEAPRAADAVQQVRGLESGISKSEFTKLSIEVNLLKRELQTLRKELQSLHAVDSSQGTPVEDAA
jgi:Sec-independent protein translocase protein TatA